MVLPLFKLTTTRKVNRAQLRVSRAFNIFAKLVKKIDKSIEELETSIETDQEEIERLQANQSSAVTGLKRHRALKEKLAEFTV